ncbi:MAG: hypothetical protein LQ344_001190 [Seirophora lacunosa]|nr:MAG: hypothetical protein LQ344_001190 [Seirophora lacunosa]
MDSRMSESSGPAQAPVRVQYHDFEALKVDLTSVHDQIMQIKGQSSVAAAPAPYPANDVEMTARPDSQVHDENAIVLRSTQGLTTSQEALSGGMIPNIASNGIGASLGTIDSALGESFSDTDMQKHEPPILQPTLIVKFSTTNPGRINGTERRQAVRYPQQIPIATMGEDTFPSQPRHNAATPPNPSQKRRGRPPGSKTKNLSSRSDIGNGISVSQGQLSKASSTKRTHKEHFVAEKNESLTQSEIMRAVWARRRRNGTDGHRGNPPTAKTIQKRQLKNGLQGYSEHMTYDVSHGSSRRQLFSGQQEIDTTSGSSMSVFAPGPRSIVRRKERHELLKTPHSEGSIRTFNAGDFPPSALPSLCRGDPFLKDADYRLDRRQRKVLRKYIRKAYAVEVRHARERILVDSAAEPFGFCRAGTDHTQHTSASLPSRTDSPRDVPLAIPDGLEQAGHTQIDRGYLQGNPPSAFDPELELACAKAALCQAGGDRPYKSAKRGHYDFVREEYISLLCMLDDTDQESLREHTDSTVELRRQLKTKLLEQVPPGEALSEESITAIVRAARSRDDSILSYRKNKSIRSFLVDVIENPIPPSFRPTFVKPTLQAKDPMANPRSTIGSLLRGREIGYGGPAQSRFALATQVAENIRPWRSWKGASSDVVTVAWAPDSLSYAAGAAAQSDEPDLQYNRPRNLLFGNLISNTICELPDHRIERPKPETINGGPNSTYAVYQACDPMVYKTVTSVQFSPTGGLLFTASDDRTVKIWDIEAPPEQPICLTTLHHQAEVTSLEVSHHHPTHFATASKTIEDSVRVYQGSQTAYQTLGFSSPRAIKHRDHDIFPECIRWGLTSGTKHLILAGYHQWADHDFSASRKGQICLWDVNTGASCRVRPHASAIFSVAWHPREDIFITGGAPGGGSLAFPKTTKSVVRSYDVRNTSHFTVEFECPALDMQDVTCHPNDSNYVTAGCTDGTAYVWDYRWPDEIMHELRHGQPLQELAPNDEELPFIEHREKVDAGVMLSIWGKGASIFYSGSSDGVIKAWDILRAPEDVWVKDIAHLPAGVQSGALSPDGMNMLVGDAVGGIHILSAAPFGSSSPSDDDNNAGFAYRPNPINFRYAAVKAKDPDDENPGTEGIECARELLRSGQLVLHPSLGVGKNPHFESQESTSSDHRQLPETREQADPSKSSEHAQNLGVIKNLIAARKEQLRSVKYDIKPFTIAFGPPTAFVANKRSYRKPADASKNVGSRSPTPIPSSSPFTALLTPGSAPATSELNEDDLTYICTTPRKRKRLHTPSAPSTPRKCIKTEAFTPSKRQSKFHPKLSQGTLEIEVVDLTGETSDVEQLASPELGSARMHAKTRMVVRDTKPGTGAMARNVGKEMDGAQRAKENLLTWEQWVEDDFWWPEGC